MVIDLVEQAVVPLLRLQAEAVGMVEEVEVAVVDSKPMATQG